MKTRTQPTTTRTNALGTKGVRRRSTRIHHRAAQRETPAELLNAYKADLDSRVRATPLTVPRWVRNHWDYTAGPVTLLALWTLCGVLSVAKAVLAPVPVLGPCVALVANAGRLAPSWLLALTAVGYWWWVWTGQHRKMARARWLQTDGAPVRELFTPEYTTTNIVKLPHRRSDYGRTPRGYSVEQYAAQHDVARDSLGHHVEIRLDRPGIVEITQIYEDLLAKPVPWRDLTDPNPEALWLGIDRDARDIHMPLTKDGSGLAALLSGAPGSGKSAEANLLLAQILAMPPELRRVWTVDPADGVDLGCWHPLSHRLAENPHTAVALLRELMADMVNRRQRMKSAGIDVCEPCPEFPWQVLVIDELPELTLNEDKKLAQEACELLARIRRVGRKTNTSILAITQDLSRDVVPKTISKIFSHRLCFKVSTYTETDIMLPGARKQGWHPERFDPDHPGRFILWNLTSYTEGRGPGLYGPRRHAIVKNLRALPPPVAPPVSAVRPVSVDSPPAVHPVTVDSPNGHHTDSPRTIPLTPITPSHVSNGPQTPAGSPEDTLPTTPARTPHELKTVLSDRGLTAGRVGINALAEATELGEKDWRVRRMLNQLGFVRRNGNYVHPEAVR